MTVEYRLLGPVEVLVDGRPVNLGGRKQRSVLATLALRVNEVVSSERLMNAVWGDEGADRATNTLQVYIYNLRRLLEPGAGKGVITSRPPGYVLNADVADVDAARFERLVGAARARTGDPEGASDSYREADACWQGAALADLAAEPFAAAEITRLESLRVDALEERIELDLGLGRHRQLVGELEALIALHPFRERLYAQLMVALYRSGRQADALAAFAEARRVLIEELGISPSRLLQDLERAVLTQDPALDAPATPPPGGPARDHPPRPDPSGGPAGEGPRQDRGGDRAGDEPRRRDHAPARVPVPRAMSSFVGRDADREQVVALVRASPLVSLVGPGGVGKTRLALEVAAVVTDGLVDDVVFTELAGITEPGQVASRVADGLGLAAIDDSAATVAGELADRRTLLVLDTCEHVLDGVAELVDEVLSRAPGCRVLTTTREVLGVPAELVWLVGPLPVPPPGAATLDEIGPAEAVRLFVERAQAADPTFVLSAGNAVAVSDLVQRLDGLPLAIELAAARVRTMSPAEISERLDDRLSLLRQSGRGGLARHQTLRATLDWSHALLFPEEQVAFRQMGVFPATFGLDAAEAICRPPAPHGVVDVVDRLVAKSLVASERQGAVTRFRLLETMQEYAREKLEQAGELDETTERHAAWFARLAMENMAGLSARHSAATLARLDRDRDNLTAALAARLDAGDGPGALSMADALVPYWMRRGRLAEARLWLERVLTDPAEPSAERVRLVAALASVLLDLGDAAGARARAAEAVAGGEGLGLERQTLLARCLLGRAYQALGELDEAEGLARHSLADADRLGDAHGAAIALRDLGALARRRGDADGARAAFEAGLARFREASEGVEDLGRLHDREQSALIAELGVLAGERGERARAEDLLGQSLALAEARGNVIGVVECLLALASVALQEGDRERVAELIAAVDLARRSADVALPSTLAAERDQLAEAAGGAERR